MIRVLTMIAVAGFVLCVGSLAAAVSIAGPEAVTRGAWTLAGDGDHDWFWGWSDGEHHRHRRERVETWTEADGKAGQRTMAWSGAEGLDIDLAADVRYIQADGPGTVTLNGPERALQHVIIRGSSIRYDRRVRHRDYPRLLIVVRAPDIHAFEVSGRNSLRIEDYRQDRLSLDVNGEGEVTAVGETDGVSMQISGIGEVDLGKLKAKGVELDISGAGDTTIAPTEWARIEASGAGEVTLLTDPRTLETDISGAGRVRRASGAVTGPSTSPSPSPSPTPSPSPATPKGSKT